MTISHRRTLLILIMLLLSFLLTACGPPKKPENIENICRIFYQYPNWYWDARKSQARWGVPVAVQMSIIRQESSFNGKAKPPRGKVLWVIPWRKSSAYGYSQVKNETWKRYKKATGSHFVSRDDFSDATDFVGWFGQEAHRRAGINPNNAYALYLAYHEGIGGYERRTYRKKEWLIKVAHRVSLRANVWNSELRRCAHKIKKPWYKF